MRELVFPEVQVVSGGYPPGVDGASGTPTIGYCGPQNSEGIFIHRLPSGTLAIDYDLDGTWDVDGNGNVNPNSQLVANVTIGQIQMLTEQNQAMSDELYRRDQVAACKSDALPANLMFGPSQILTDAFCEWLWGP